MKSVGLSPRMLFAAFVLLLALAPLVLPEFTVTLLNYIGLYALVALGLVLLTGVGGLTSFGQAAFVGLGAYTTAVLTTATELPVWLAWIGSSAWPRRRGRCGNWRPCTAPSSRRTSRRT